MAGDDYDYWLFDLDGTVVDVEPWYPRRVFSEVGRRLGADFSDREADVLWYGAGPERQRLLAEHDLDYGLFWEVFHEVEDPEARAEATFLYDDAEFIAGLDEPAGLVTHCQSYLTGPVLDHLDVRDWFDTVVCCTDETGWKPDPAPVELAQRNLGVAHNGHEGVLAGDSPADIGAAWNTGLEAVHVQRFDPEERGVCVMGDYRVESFADLY